MSVTVTSIDANSDTFANWVAITNQMAQTISNAVITANTTEGVTGNSTVSYNAKLFGQFQANTIKINNTVSGPTGGANVNLEANLTLVASSKLFTVGDLSVKGNIIIDTTSKLRFVDRSTTYSANTGWLKANSTGYVQIANLAVKGTDLDPNEFVLTSNVGYATSTNSLFDVITYNTASSKWVRTSLLHLASQEIDALTLGLITANSSGTVRVNANIQFGGTSSSLFVANTVARVGVGAGITNPQSSLHVNGAIYATGDITAYYTSDKRLKNNIVKIDDALEKVRWLNGVKFDWNKDAISNLVDVGPKPDNDIGLIAQDVEKIFPEVVTERADGYKAVDYSRLVPVLIEAIKELSYRVNILEAELEDKYRISSR